MRDTTREERRQLARANAKLPAALIEIPSSKWPERIPPRLVRVWRSRDFLVQEYAPETAGMPRRLSICKSSVNVTEDRWEDGITWDDLQRLKREAGYGDIDAVEIYPKDSDTVNVANLRHLWLMDEPIMFAWRKR